jgi:hypothetical protein
MKEQAQNALRQPFFDWLEEKGYPKFDIKEVGNDVVKFSVFSGDKESDLPEEYEPNFLLEMVLSGKRICCTLNMPNPLTSEEREDWSRSLEIGAGQMAIPDKPIKDDSKPFGALHRD